MGITNSEGYESVDAIYAYPKLYFLQLEGGRTGIEMFDPPDIPAFIGTGFIRGRD